MYSFFAMLARVSPFYIYELWKVRNYLAYEKTVTQVNKLTENYDTG